MSYSLSVPGFTFVALSSQVAGTASVLLTTLSCGHKTNGSRFLVSQAKAFLKVFSAHFEYQRTILTEAINSPSPGLL